ncbi:MAG: NYN domain-containing protein [Phycisphaerae bacterium]
MPVLVDGNNLLYAAREIDDPDRVPGRAMLCSLLGQWAKRRSQTVHVVFDGPKPDGGFAEQIKSENVEVTFSAARSADDVLIELLAANSAPRLLIVVSSDREVRRAASRCRAVATMSDAFWHDVRRDLRRPEQEVREPNARNRALSAEESAEWMEEFGFDTDAEDSD